METIIIKRVPSLTNTNLGLDDHTYHINMLQLLLFSLHSIVLTKFKRNQFCTVHNYFNYLTKSDI